MSVRHFFNRYREPFVYFLTVLFLLLIAGLYIWGIDSIATTVSSSFEAAAPAGGATGFNLSAARDISILNAVSTSSLP